MEKINVFNQKNVITSSANLYSKYRGLVTNQQSLNMIDQISATNDSWGLLFKCNGKAIRTRKIFRNNIAKVLKIMIFMSEPTFFKIGSLNSKIGFYYYSHGVIMGRTNLPKWTYYNVIKFLKKTKILFVKKENIWDVSQKRLSYKLFERLDLILTSKYYTLGD